MNTINNDIIEKVAQGRYVAFKNCSEGHISIDRMRRILNLFDRVLKLENPTIKPGAVKGGNPTHQINLIRHLAPGSHPKEEN